MTTRQDSRVTVEMMPCPAGHSDTRVIGGSGTAGGPKYWAGCDHCNWRAWGNTQAEAVEAWNTRAASGDDDVQTLASKIAECDRYGSQVVMLDLEHARRIEVLTRAQPLGGDELVERIKRAIAEAPSHYAGMPISDELSERELESAAQAVVAALTEQKEKRG